MLGELVGLTRPLHLDQAYLGPDHVDEPARPGALLEGRHFLAGRAVAGEELVAERLRLCFLGPLVATPIRSEARQIATDLLVGERHSVQLEARLSLGGGEVGAVPIVPREFPEVIAQSLGGFDEMGLSAKLLHLLGGPLGPGASLL